MNQMWIYCVSMLTNIIQIILRVYQIHHHGLKAVAYDDGYDIYYVVEAKQGKQLMKVE